MAEPVGLGAAEAFVLLSLPRFDARQTLKFGLMELLAQGILHSEERSRAGLVHTRRVLHLYVAPGVPGNLPPVARALVGVVDAAAAQDGVIGEVVKQAMRVFHRSLAGFVIDGVGPALVARGLAESRHRRLMGLIPHDSFYRTAAGDAEKIRVETALREARAIPQYFDSDPMRAAALAAAAGGAILLVEALRPHYRQLAKAFETPDQDIAPFPPFTDVGGGEGEFHFGCIDFGSIDSGCFDSFDVGFDAASDVVSDSGSADGGSSC